MLHSVYPEKVRCKTCVLYIDVCITFIGILSICTFICQSIWCEKFENWISGFSKANYIFNVKVHLSFGYWSKKFTIIDSLITLFLFYFCILTNCISDPTKYCPSVSTIHNGHCFCESQSDLQYCEPFYQGLHVECVCNEGYKLIGQSIVTCGANGRWDYMMPSCVHGKFLVLST